MRRGIKMEERQAHIRLSREDSAKYAILPGDPGRIDHIKKYLTDAKELQFNREMRSVSGYYKGIKVLAVSTGMGGASTGITVEELHNIGVEYMIRIGSCGALDPSIHLGDLILVNGAVRDDGASKAYIESIYPAIPDTRLLMATILAAEEHEFSFHIGRARSHDSFYTDREDEIDAYWSKQGILGADMETAALFTIGALRGVKCASILNTVVEFEEDLEKNINEYVDGESVVKQGEANEIITALEAFLIESNKIQK
jgi:uridine phosphorylase